MMMKKTSLNKAYSFNRQFKLSPDLVEKFAQASTDFNPVHLDEDYASKTIFKKRIAHGFLIGSFISAVLGNDFPGNGTIYLSQLMKFKAPVYLNDTIKVYVEIVEFMEKGRLKIATRCINQDGIIVIDGEAVVIPPKGFLDKLK
jgi:3-hydroxybutyryl-CoA dehydratase